MNAAEPGIAKRRRGSGRRAARARSPGLQRVAHRCPCGLPDVVQTAPRLPDGTPFPTVYYLTCPRAAAAVSGLEAAGRMREMTDRLADEQLKARYGRAHQDYLAHRAAAAVLAGVEPLPAGTQSAGGMPERVKCLHALVAHELAVPGVEPVRPRGARRDRPVVDPRPLRSGARGDGVTIHRVAAIDCGTNSIRLLIADINSKTEGDVERTVGSRGCAPLP